MGQTKENRIFGKWLQDSRKSAGLSLRELSELSQIDYSMISKVEQGRRFLSDEKIIRLSQIFRINSSEPITLKNKDKELRSTKKIADKDIGAIPGFRPYIEADVIKHLKTYRQKKGILRLTFPLDIEDFLAVIFGLKVQYVSFSEKGFWKSGEPKKLAALFVKDKTIMVNTDQGEKKDILTMNQRFSLAHEGSHYIQLKKEARAPNQPIFFRSKDLHNKEETTTNYWAGAFLMPKPHLTDKIKKLSSSVGNKNIVVDLSKIGEALCKEFGVSRQALEIRLYKTGVKCINTAYVDDARQLYLFK